MVALEQDYAGRAQCFVGEQEHDDLHTSFAAIHVIAHEDILYLWVANQKLGCGMKGKGLDVHVCMEVKEEREQVEELSMQVSQDHRRLLGRHHATVALCIQLRFEHLPLEGPQKGRDVPRIHSRHFAVPVYLRQCRLLHALDVQGRAPLEVVCGGRQGRPDGMDVAYAGRTGQGKKPQRHGVKDFRFSKQMHVVAAVKRIKSLRQMWQDRATLCKLWAALR